MSGSPANAHDSVDLREVRLALVRGRWFILGGVLAGLLLAALVTSSVRPRYQSTASVVLRSETPTLGLGTSLPFGLGIGLGGQSQLDTEIEILTSRALMGLVVDSLRLAVAVESPHDTPARRIVTASSFPEAHEPLKITGRSDGELYLLRAGEAEVRVRPGEVASIAGGRLELAASGVPPEFELAVLSREAAIVEALRSFRAERLRGEVARLTFTGHDRETPAASLNLLLDTYMERRRTSDRGLNQHRLEFVTEAVDSIRIALEAAEEQLRRYQEESGVVDPELSAESDLGRAMALRSSLEDLDIEARALDAVAAGRIRSTRDVAGYPTLLQNPAVASLLGRLTELEGERLALRDRRTDEDPDIVVLDASIAQVEAELGALARSYVVGVNAKRAQVARELVRYDDLLAAMPARAEQIFRLRREVRRLTETQAALEGQRVQTRMAAIGEGGDVRILDDATPALRPVYPIPVVNYGLGLFGGLFFGMIAAFVAGRRRARVVEPWEAELATGGAAVHLNPGGPLLLGLLDRSRTVLVLAVGEGASPRAVAERLASTGALQGHRVVLADLRTEAEVAEAERAWDAGVGTALQVAGHGGALAVPSRPSDPFTTWSPDGERAPLAVRGAVQDLEDQFDRTVVVLPGLNVAVSVALMAGDRPIVLAARAGFARRGELAAIAAELEQQGVPVAATVIHDGNGYGPRRG